MSGVILTYLSACSHSCTDWMLLFSYIATFYVYVYFCVKFVNYWKSVVSQKSARSDMTDYILWLKWFLMVCILDSFGMLLYLCVVFAVFFLHYVVYCYTVCIILVVEFLLRFKVGASQFETFALSSRYFERLLSVQIFVIDLSLAQLFNEDFSRLNIAYTRHLVIGRPSHWSLAV